MFLEVSQNSQENTCARDSFFNKVVGLRPVTLLKKSLWHSCFPVNFAKFLRTLFHRTPSDGCFYRSITNRSGNYDEKDMKVKFNSDDDLPLKKNVRTL